MNDDERYAAHYGEPIPPAAPSVAVVPDPVNEAPVPDPIAAAQLAREKESTGCVRWLLFLPSAFFMARYVDKAGNDPATPALVTLLLLFLVAPVVFVVVGALVAPRARFVVALGLASFQGLRFAYDAADRWSTPVPAFCYVPLAIGLFGVLVLFWRADPPRLGKPSP